jgi:hypothetical protein
MQALLHLQTRSANRYARVQELVSDVAGAVQTGLDGLGNTNQDTETATRIAGKLVTAADQLAPAVKSSHTLVLHARDLVGRLLPPEVVQAAAQDAVHRDASGLTPGEAAQMLGRYDNLDGLDVLDAGLTGEFEAVRPLDEDQRSDLAIPPLTMPLPVIKPESFVAGVSGASAGTEAGVDQAEMQAQLLELWQMLDRLAVSLGHQYRTLRSISRELGKLSRSVRSTDAGVVHGVASLEAARAAVKDLQDAVRPGRTPVSTDEHLAGLPRRPAGSSVPSSMPLGTPDERPGAAELLGLRMDDSFPADLAGDGGQLDVRQLLDPDVLGNSSPDSDTRRLRMDADPPA